ncbi:MAG: hypothetical protein ACJ8M1_15550 [Chthoniobacterales bacterium]
MKVLLALAALASCVPIVGADDIKLANGAEYKSVRISRVEPDGIVVVTKTGIIKLFFVDLPKDVQEKYQYDPKKAEDFRFRLDAARDAATEQVALEQQRHRQPQGGTPRLEQVPKSDSRKIAALSLEAHEIGTGDGTYDRWFVDWDYYSRDFVRQKRLLITIRDFSRQVSEVTVHAYFICHPIGREAPLAVYGHAIIPVQLNRNLEVSGTIDAPPLGGHTTRIGGFQSAHGADIDGWIVSGEINNQRFQMRASRQRLLDLAENHPNELDEMISDYESKHRRR